MLTTILQSVTALWARGKREGSLSIEDAERLRQYVRFKQLYHGTEYQGPLAEQRQIKCLVAYAGPIIDIAAGLIASKPLVWSVEGDGGEKSETGSKLAAKIWDRSGGERKFLQSATSLGVKGDQCVMVRRHASGKPVLNFVNPANCFPEFDPINLDRIEKLHIIIPISEEEGAYEEIWENGTVQYLRNGKEAKRTEEYNPDLYDGGVPAVWIRNKALEGECYGTGDLGLIERTLSAMNQQVENHLKVSDRAASLHYKFKNISKSDFEREVSGKFDELAAFFLAKDQDVELASFEGKLAALKDDVDIIRKVLADISMTPLVAFGDPGVSIQGDLSGAALSVLFGPLKIKVQGKQATYGPSLERAMAFAMSKAAGMPLYEDEIDVVFPDPLPANMMEIWNTAELQNRIGMPFEQILKERGYDEAEQRELAKQRKTELDEQATRDAKTAGPGSPEKPKTVKDNSKPVRK